MFVYLLMTIVISCVRGKLDKTWQMSPPQIGEKPPSGFWLQICSGHDRIQTIDGHAGWAKLTCLSTPKPQRSVIFKGKFFLSKLRWIPFKKSTCVCLWKGLVLSLQQTEVKLRNFGSTKNWLLIRSRSPGAIFQSRNRSLKQIMSFTTLVYFKSTWVSIKSKRKFLLH